MVSCKAFNILPSGFLITIVLMHYALPWSTTADSTPLVARSGGVLKVLVPIKTDFKEFVDCAHDSNVKGFCIDVFKNALSILIPKPSWTDVEYQCYQIGADSYDTMVDLLAASKDIDAVVGDITISAARSVNASFTQTYLDSGIVIVAPVEGVSQSFLGVFFAPFTIQTWAFILGSFLLAGSALWLLEHNNQPSLQEAQSGLEQLKSIFWHFMIKIYQLPFPWPFSIFQRVGKYKQYKMVGS